MEKAIFSNDDRSSQEELRKNDRKAVTGSLLLVDVGTAISTEVGCLLLHTRSKN